MACDQVCVLCDSLCSCVDGLRPSRDRAAVGSTVAGHRGGHACPRRLHLMACVETKHPATRSALGRAARGSRAGAQHGSSSGDIPTAFCNRQISSTTTIKVERVPLRTARAINSRHGPARVSRHDAARRPSPVFLIYQYGSWENNQSLHENNQKWHHTTFW